MTTVAPPGPNRIRLRDAADGSFTTCFFDVEAFNQEVIQSLGHEPNGYFWEGVVRWLIDHGELPDVQTDPEGTMFYAYGDRADAEELATRLMRYLTDSEAITRLVTQADAVGFDFDDDQR
ncbi:Uncharacterised protein [Actinomyces bovis]|uniref:Immunity protein 51 n=1 Tax=Actinomyces bovis TaxID=1658 RepID=A0ABY1VK70_9ACTO|nr:Imm51 family immunity protein [Actinomyces bovis]SPT52500.1 Uncharacterised protein [Actinomyces bovis]VEG54214.1 Uncharacterised protein [Actinomyces israelii]